MDRFQDDPPPNSRPADRWATADEGRPAGRQADWTVIEERDEREQAEVEEAEGRDERERLDERYDRLIWGAAEYDTDDDADC